MCCEMSLCEEVNVVFPHPMICTFPNYFSGTSCFLETASAAFPSPSLAPGSPSPPTLSAARSAVSGQVGRHTDGTVLCSLAQPLHSSDALEVADLGDGSCVLGPGGAESIAGAVLDP